MNKYIEAEALKAFMRAKLTGNDLYTPNGIDEFVDGLPAADVVKRVYRGRRPSDDLVKVVRCKDCKYRKNEQPSMVYCPHMIGGWVDENWFCAGGQKE